MTSTSRGRSTRHVGRALALGVVMLLTACLGDAQPALVEAPVGWDRLPDPPLEARRESVTVWTGDGILVFGGNDFICAVAGDCNLGGARGFTDGALYDLTAERWTSIADAPVAIWSGTAVAVGDDVFVLTYNPRRPEQSLLRYTPADDAWAELDLPESFGGIAAIAARTDELVLYPTTDEFGPHADWRLRRDRDRWERLPVDPLGASFDRVFASAGRDLFLFGRGLLFDGDITRPDPSGLVRAARLRGGRWETLPATGTIRHSTPFVEPDRIVFASVGCTKPSVAQGCVPNGAVFDLTDETWTELPGADAFGRDRRSAGVANATQVDIHDTGHPFFDASTDTWSLVPRIAGDVGRDSERAVRGVGSFGFVFGGVRFDETLVEGAKLLDDAWIWTPDAA